ncbi:MAG TPA: YbhB/YbcL family Raf kinase inhibitor-like protein [Balneolaceae bacterium]|nr:YbhB/YbcL family Raf kinase inhibitor-like protein [Balneolaceae bacterium]
MALELKSTAFENGEFIPAKYSCDGTNVSPPLEWTDVPANTKSFALIVDDPDAPSKTWVHWVLYNIPVDNRKLIEDQPEGKKLTNGTLQGNNDFQITGYRGPCPPGGTHRYYFKLYALDTILNIAPAGSKQQLLSAMKDHMIEQAELMGKYTRQR